MPLSQRDNLMLAGASSAPNVQRRKRASKPRVRTGCKTCKIRRVKCDEGIPICSNCLKLGRECSYGKGTGTESRSVVVQHRPIAPKQPLQAKSGLTKISMVSAFRKNHSLAPKLQTPAWSTPTRSPKASLFTTEEECRYFTLFREKTMFTLAGYFKTSLWDRIVLQSCEYSPAIRACVVAIGALDQTLDSVQRGLAEKAWRAQDSSKEKIHEGKTHHEFALRQYGRAIRELKQSLSANRSDMRSALIACMLTVCFEALNGDMQSAITQVRNGRKLIREYLPTGASAISARLNSAAEINEIIQAFDRLDNDSVVTQDAEPIDFNTETGATTPDEAMKRMPFVFESLEEAKIYYEYFVNEFIHWIAFQYAWGSRQKDETKERLANSKVMASVSEQRKLYLKALSQWYCAFEPLLVSSRSKGGGEYIAAIALDCRFKCLDAANNANHFLGEMSYDEITPKFQEVVDLVKILIDHESTLDVTKTAKFTFEGTIVSSMYAVALKCRDPSVRRQAIYILESRPRREGVFDSALQAKIARIQMDIENSGQVGGTIPEHSRIRGIKTTCDMMKREGHMKYLKMDPVTREFSYKYLDFTW